MTGDADRFDIRIVIICFLFLACFLLPLQTSAKTEDVQLDGATNEISDRTMRLGLETLLRMEKPVHDVAASAMALVEQNNLSGARGAVASGAASLARQADAESDRLAYRDAAKRYRQAAQLSHLIDQHAEWAYLIKEGGAWFDQTDKFVDDAAVDEAIAAFRRAVAAAPRSRRPLDWALSQTKLGEALHRRGSHYDDSAAYREALFVFRQVLGERNSLKDPAAWAESERNVCNTLRDLGDLTDRTAPNDAVFGCYQEVLSAYSRSGNLDDWGWTQLALGNAYRSLGSRATRPARLEKAAALYLAALRVIRRDSNAELFGNLARERGNALKALADQGGKIQLLYDGVSALQEALAVYDREHTPRDWATTQSDLGDVLVDLGTRTNNNEMLRQAVAAYRSVLTEWTPERDLDEWAMTQVDLGDTLYLLGTRERGTTELTEAAAAYQEFLKHQTGEHDTERRQATQRKIDATMRAILERKDRHTALPGSSMQRLAASETFEQNDSAALGQCKSTRGHAMQAGKSGKLVCVFDFADGGKACRQGRECLSGLCETHSNIHTSDMTGRCKTDTYMYACHAFVEDGRIISDKCVD